MLQIASQYVSTYGDATWYQSQQRSLYHTLVYILTWNSISMLTCQVLLPAAEYPLAARLAHNQHVSATHNCWKAVSTDAQCDFCLAGCRRT